MGDIPKLISIYSTIYYNGLDELEVDGTKYYPISDSEFDELLTQVPDSDPIKSTTGFDSVAISDKAEVAHRFPTMGISNKTKDFNYVRSLFLNKESVVTPKLDGTSITLEYLDGKFVRSLTRGNGTLGRDVSDIVSQLPSVPKSIPDTGSLFIRGELLQVSINNDNIRNQSNGLVNRKNYTLTEDELNSFKFIPFEIQNTTTDKVTELQRLSELGFLPIPYKVGLPSDLPELISELTKDGELTSDGLVITDNVIIDNSSNYTQRDLVAYKFNSSSVETVVTDIQWNKSPYGKYFPTIVIDTVNIDGARVSKVSGGSYRYLKNNGLGIGSKVSVIRSGGVIPYIDKVLTRSDNLNPPSDSYESGAHLYSKSDMDEGVCVSNLFFRYKTKGYSWKLLCKIMDTYPGDWSLHSFRKLVDKYELLIDKSKFTNHEWNGVEILFDTIRKAKVSLIEILEVASIEGLGWANIRSILDNFKSISSFIDYVKSGGELRSITNSKIESELRSNLPRLLDVVEFYKDSIEYIPEFKDNNDSGESPRVKVVLTNFTGSPIKKSDFLATYPELLEVGKVEEADLVIYFKDGSKKVTKAKELNIKLMKVTEYVDLHS